MTEQERKLKNKLALTLKHLSEYQKMRQDMNNYSFPVIGNHDYLSIGFSFMQFEELRKILAPTSPLYCEMRQDSYYPYKIGFYFKGCYLYIITNREGDWLWD